MMAFPNVEKVIIFAVLITNNIKITYLPFIEASSNP